MIEQLLVSGVGGLRQMNGGANQLYDDKRFLLPESILGESWQGSFMTRQDSIDKN